MRGLVIFVLTALLLGACGKTTDEEQIQANIAAITKAVENRKFSAIQDYLDEGFRANEYMDAQQVKQLLMMYGLQHKNLGITVVSSNTTMDAVYPDRAQTTMSVVVTGSSGGLPSDGNVRTVSVEWVKNSGNWAIRKASWQD
jgi:hypothetical protein